MSILNHSPTIVRDGLIYCIDATAKQSYSGSGSVWKNIVDNNVYKGTITNATFNWQPVGGTGGSYFSFDGSDDYVEAETNVTPATGPFSAVIWIKVTDLSAGGGRGGLFERQESSPYNGMSFGKGGSGSWYFSVSGLDPVNSLLVSTTYPTVGVWASYCGTYNGSTDVAFYHNDSLVGSDSGVDQGNLDAEGARLPLKLARRDTIELPCEIAHVAIYNVELTYQQIKQNYRALKGRFGL